MNRRGFLGALTVAAAGLFVPQYGRWHRQGSGLPHLWLDGVHDDLPALNRLLAMGEPVKIQQKFLRLDGRIVVPAGGVLWINQCTLDFTHAPPGSLGAVVERRRPGHRMMNSLLRGPLRDGDRLADVPNGWERHAGYGNELHLDCTP